LGIFLPVYLVVILCAPSPKRWAKNAQLNAFVRDVTAAATGAIAGALIVLARRSVYDVRTFLIAVISLVVLLRSKVPEPASSDCSLAIAIPSGEAGLAARV
jgi:chromate transporter